MKAEQIQPRDDPARRVAERHQRAVAAAISAGISSITDSIDPDSLVRAIESNDFARVWRHLALERLGPALRPALNALAFIHDRLAFIAAEDIVESLTKAGPSKLKTPAVIPLTYDPLKPETVAAQNAANEKIVQRVTSGAQATAEQVLADGLRNRQSARAIARRLRETLGMTTQEANAIANYRLALEQGSASALARGLRDRRFDATIRRGDALGDDQIERMVERYAARYRAFRAERIAHTEALRAANEGRAAGYQQYAEITGRGDEFRRFWLTAADELVCRICEPIPAMNPDGVRLNELYATALGPQDRPPIHPLCRCTEKFVRFGAQ